MRRDHTSRKVTRAKDRMLEVIASDWLSVNQICALIGEANEGLMGRYLDQMAEDGEVLSTRKVSVQGRLAVHYRRKADDK